MSITIYLLFKLFYNGGMKITEHFDSKEFDCKDGTPYPPQWIETRLRPLCEALEAIRQRLGVPLHINSGYRTPAYNKKVGGALFSQHCQGLAADISSVADPFHIQIVITELIHRKVIRDGGVGLYKSWVHIDHGPRRRWHG